MKKIILASSGMFLGLAAYAQQGHTDNVTLNVKLNPIQTLVVNPAQKTVDLTYQSKADYENGVNSLQNDHLEIFSTGGFQVKVKTEGSQLVNNQAGPNGNINANTVQIIPTAGSQAIANAQYDSRLLSTDEQVIVTSTKGAVDKNINIEYKGANANAYIDYYVAGQTPTVYTTTVTYTIYAN